MNKYRIQAQANRDQAHAEGIEGQQTRFIFQEFEHCVLTEIHNRYGHMAQFMHAPDTDYIIISAFQVSPLTQRVRSRVYKLMEHWQDQTVEDVKRPAMDFINGGTWSHPLMRDGQRHNSLDGHPTGELLDCGDWFNIFNEKERDPVKLGSRILEATQTLKGLDE